MGKRKASCYCEQTTAKFVYLTQGIKKIILRYKLETEKFVPTQWESVVSKDEWKNQLLQRIQKDYIEVTENHLTNWFQKHSWILEYKGRINSTQGDILLTQVIQDMKECRETEMPILITNVRTDQPKNPESMIQNGHSTVASGHEVELVDDEVPSTSSKAPRCDNAGPLFLPLGVKQEYESALHGINFFLQTQTSNNVAAEDTTVSSEQLNHTERPLRPVKKSLNAKSLENVLNVFPLLEQVNQHFSKNKELRRYLHHVKSLLEKAMEQQRKLVMPNFFSQLKTERDDFEVIDISDED